MAASSTRGRQPVEASDPLRTGLLAPTAPDMIPPMMIATCTCLLLALTLPSDIDADEEVVFYETYGTLSEDGQTWSATVHGVVYEPERDSKTRDAFMKVLRSNLDLDAAEGDTERLEQRVRAFLVDHERGETLEVRVGDDIFEMQETDAGGRFSGELTLPADAASATSGGTVEVTAVLDEGDERRFVGSIHLVPPTGISVISDIDDTIKITGVGDQSEMLANTFLREFRAVSGMAEMYRGLADQGMAFHYVSGSPSPLYQPLREFLFEPTSGFPAGSMHLRDARMTDGEILELLEPSVEHKLGHIRALLAAFPGRRFILIGDSGELDAQIYTTIAEEHPEQVYGLLIRNVGGDLTRENFGDLLPSRARYFNTLVQASNAIGRWTADD
jgi:phosphatidate phosphatase APP1